MAETLTPTRPYLLRAMHEWMSDNNQTPLVVIDATADGVTVPQQHVQDGRIILNISWSATQNLVLDNEHVTFSARFSGKSNQVVVPIAAIQGIYARESGQGMMFQDEPGANDAGSNAAGLTSVSGQNDKGDDGDDDPSPPPKRGGLRLVK
jgi:stringent starvation protein B